MSNQDQRAAAYPSSGVSPPVKISNPTAMPGVIIPKPASPKQTFPAQVLGLGDPISGGYPHLDAGCYPLLPPQSPTNPNPQNAFIPVAADPSVSQGSGQAPSVIQVTRKSAAAP